MEPAELPADAVEVGRIVDAWGIKGWFKVQPHSADPQALFSSKRWFLTWPQQARGLKPVRPGEAHLPALMRIREAREHGAVVVASAHDVLDRAAAESLKGAAISIARSSFPSTADDEFYWVDLIGLKVVNRSGEILGSVADLLPTGPQTVLIVRPDTAGPEAPRGPREHLIPFVSAYVDEVDRAARTIRVDWQADYLD